MYHNVVAQTSQINLLQQQQQQQPNNQQQPMQSQQYYCYPTNQQGSYNQNQYGQPYQQEPYTVGQPQQQIPRSGVGNFGQPNGQTAYNIPSVMQNQSHGYGSLPSHILDQIRAYIGNPAPIFILPNNCPNPVATPQAITAPGPSMPQGCPGIGINCPSTPIYYPPGSCYPYPMAMPLFNPFVASNQNNSKESNKNCGCCSTRRVPGNFESHTTSTYNTNEQDQHNCIGGNDDTVCNKRNCPSAINLQALASQLLAIQGIIACAATRLVLRKIAGSNITSSMEETIERAKRSLDTLTQEQLLSETRQAQQVNALINLHMTANPPTNVIPILTTLQLKVNMLKAHVDSSINRRLSESQGAEGNGNLDPVILALKSDQELRDLLGTLRQKECDERVNLNFSPYQSQRVIAQSRFNNIQNKISQVETEMERRRGATIPRSSIAQQFSDPGWYGYTGDVSNISTSGGSTARSTQNYQSPDPFRFQMRSPKRLNLRPHVGSPETTYERPKKTSPARSSGSRKDSDDEDCDDNTKNSARDPSTETNRCACEKSSEDDSADENKKKLGGKIHVERDQGNTNESDRRNNSGVSILKLSKNVVIVIDNPYSEPRRNEDSNDVKEILEEKVKNINKTEIDNNEKLKKTKTQSSVGKMVNDNDKTTTSGTTMEKVKRFKWGKKKERIENENMEKKVLDNSEIKEKQIYETEIYDETAKPVEEIKEENIVNFTKSEGPEPIREETVQMITKIHYVPSVFRAFLNPLDEPPEKDRIIEERFKASFTEDSLKSISTESTVDSNQTPESLSLRVKESEESSPSPVKIPHDVERIVESSTIQNLRRVEAMTEEKKIEDENNRIKDKINDNSKIIHRSGPSRHNDENEEAACEEDHHEKKNKEEVIEDHLISGAVNTIGNHVSSFGSIIGKIAALKLHQVAESSQTIFGNSSTNERNEIDVNVEENEAESNGATSGKSMKSNVEIKKEIGKWKYIKFAEIDERMSVNSVEEISIDESYALPKIKHSVIEDKRRGSKYVVIEEPSEDLRRELGEPYKTGRSLIIRSRPKSPQSIMSEQSGPFTMVKGVKHRDNNCLALHFVSSRSSKKNRSKESHDLKSSEKFWFRPPETREERNIRTNETHELIADECCAETSKFPTNDSIDKDETAVADSCTLINEERVVQVHEYSKISITSSSIKLLKSPGNIENTETVINSIA